MRRSILHGTLDKPQAHRSCEAFYDTLTRTKRGIGGGVVAVGLGQLVGPGAVFSLVTPVPSFRRAISVRNAGFAVTPGIRRARRVRLLQSTVNESSPTGQTVCRRLGIESYWLRLLQIIARYEARYDPGMEASRRSTCSLASGFTDRASVLPAVNWLSLTTLQATPDVPNKK